tara:strand:- start:9 stop:185 length:177 start_codon:yes stop_codon:yes gene_type:complete
VVEEEWVTLEIDLAVLVEVVLVLNVELVQMELPTQAVAEVDQALVILVEPQVDQELLL